LDENMKEAGNEGRQGTMADIEDAKQPNVELTTMTPEQRAEIARGLRFAHVMMTANRDQGNAALAYIQALGGLLVRKGIISEEEMKEPLERARTEISRMDLPRVHLGDSPDKYAPEQNVEIDCENRIHLCQARCCTFRFYLTKQDLKEGAAEWDYGNPYWVKQREDGYCVHNDPRTRFCAIHARRPATCRVFDCRNDKRIWIDFEKRIPAPIEAAGYPFDDPFSGMMPIGSGAILMRRDEEERAGQDQNDGRGSS
jgi:Fe-S-cluster containining protein